MKKFEFISKLFKSSNRTLLDPLELGDIILKNRIVMAPMTRLRATTSGVPTAIMASYFAQRASAGLIVTDCTMVSPLAHGYEHCPGIFSLDQIAAWKTVTETVHLNKGTIFLQLWHCGRRSHPLLLDGELPVAPYPKADPGYVHTREGKKPAPKPDQLSIKDIHDVVDTFSTAAKNALLAGFDGVEIHGANGYLIDQFLHSSVNLRKDKYGGSIPNRVRFLLEIVEAVRDIVGPSRVGVKLSPGNIVHGMVDDDAPKLFEYAIKALSNIGIVYLHLFNPVEIPEINFQSIDNRRTLTSEYFRSKFDKSLIANGNYNYLTAATAVTNNNADMISFGRLFIANPDLPTRFAQGLPLNKLDPATLYSGGEHGYIDYPMFNKDVLKMPKPIGKEEKK